MTYGQQQTGLLCSSLCDVAECWREKNLEKFQVYSSFQVTPGVLGFQIITWNALQDVDHMMRVVCGFCRRGNWITLKMKKLIKPKSRERMRSLTQTPSRSESSEGFLTLPHPDSQDSSSIGSGSNSLEDSLTQRSGSEYLSGLTFLQSERFNIVKRVASLLNHSDRFWRAFHTWTR